MTVLSVSTPPAATGPRTLVVGASGFIGRFVAEASLSSGHPTYVLVRSSATTSSSKASTIKSLEDQGAILVTVMPSILLSVLHDFPSSNSLFDCFLQYFCS